jgi:hypothetical protein
MTYVLIGSLLLASYPQLVVPGDIQQLSASRLEKRLLAFWFPRQQAAIDFLSKAKLTQHGQGTVAETQLGMLADLLEPGDILIYRRHGYLTNFITRGFWKHTALYTGSLETLDAYFQEVAPQRLGCAVSCYLARQYPAVVQESVNRPPGQRLATIESTVQGVVLKTLRESTTADALALIRPRMGKGVKLDAIIAAFAHYRKPYDYNFNFETDSGLCCSELVCKSYASAIGLPNPFGRVKRAGQRQLLSPNDMAHFVAGSANTSKRRFDPVMFLYDSDLYPQVLDNDFDVFCQAWHNQSIGLGRRLITVGSDGCGKGLHAEFSRGAAAVAR